MKNRPSRDYNQFSNHNHNPRDADRSRRIRKTDRFDEKYPVFYRSRSPRRGEIRERFYDDYSDFDIDVARKYTRDGYERFNIAGGDNYMNVRRVSLEYDLYVRDDNGRSGPVVRTSLERGEVGRHVLETGGLGSDDENLGYFHRQNELLLEKRNGELRDHDESGIERGSSRYVDEDLFSSRDTNFFSSLARSEEFISSSSGVSRKNIRERENGHLASESVHFNTRSRSRSYLGLPGETRADHLYARKGKIYRYVEEYREQHTSRMSVLESTVESSRGKRKSDDGLWETYSSSRGRPTPYDGYGSMKHQDFRADVDGGQVSHHEYYDVSRTREYEPPIDRRYDSPRKRSEPSESERRLIDEHFRIEAFAHQVSIMKEYDAPNSSRRNYPQVSGLNKVDLVSLPRKKKTSKYDYEKERRMPSQRDQSHSSYPVKFGSGNIKRRMGPIPKKRNHS